MAPLTTSCSEIDMSVTGNWARDMEKVPSTIQMAANTKRLERKLQTCSGVFTFEDGT